ncbi:MAG: hypothetical protein OEV81_00940 [Betaproteobacteria bacterium]|nr:hypothetical protein [Betaproteobacteria bacterium]MDH5220876.1 hypothetical protein [Betaproteobacteria bacterium]MDH5349254.1 hypothetical protein [Betaproteobacteria bacterium]
MRKALLIPILLTALAAMPAQAGEISLGIGPLVLSEDGADFHISYRADASHWEFGYRYSRYSESTDDPYFGGTLTESTTTMQGPTLFYQFKPEANGTWFVGAAVLKAERVERALLVNEEAHASKNAFFFGGGYLGRWGRYGFYRLGMLVSPGAKLNTKTSASSTEESGLADIYAQIGLRF